MPTQQLTKEQVVQRQMEKKKDQWERKKTNKAKDQKRKAERDSKNNSRTF